MGDTDWTSHHPPRRPTVAPKNSRKEVDNDDFDVGSSQCHVLFDHSRQSFLLSSEC